MSLLAKKKGVVSLVLVGVLFFCYLSEKPKQTDLKTLEKIQLPERLENWRSTIIKPEADFKKDDRYNFLSGLQARMYGTRYQEQILMLLLDGGNFHNPKVCFGGSGFKTNEIIPKNFYGWRLPIRNSRNRS